MSETISVLTARRLARTAGIVYLVIIVLYAVAFPGGQADVLAYLPFALQPIGLAISLFVFAGYCLISGYLIYRSGFLPRALGVLLAVAGICYATNSLAFFLAPSLKDQLILILVPCFVGESALAVWLTLAGVNGERWRQRADRSRAAVADQVAPTPVS